MEIDKLVKKQILDIKPYRPGKPIEELKREIGLGTIFKLASNENPLGPSAKVIDRIKDVLGNIHRYPDGGCFKLKQLLSEKFSSYKLKPENFIIGNGSNEIIELALHTFVNPGERVISCFPTFLIYKISSLVIHADFIEVPLDNDFDYDLKAIENKINDKTKMIFISNPNNPTGTYIKAEKLKIFLEKLPSNIIVILDEAYFEFIDKDVKFDFTEYIYKKPLIIMRTFSKAYGLSGLRIGYGIADSKCIEYLNRVRQPFNVNFLAQEAAIQALKDEEYLDKTKQIIFEQKQYIYTQLEKLGLDYVKSQANFILINIKRNSEDIFNKMLKKGIIIRPMIEYGLDNYIRVTIGKQKENEKFIEVLCEIL